MVLANAPNDGCVVAAGGRQCLGFVLSEMLRDRRNQGKSMLQRTNNQPDVAGWNLPLCYLAVLEGTLPWPFFWRQGCCPRRSSSWSCNAVPCSSTAASWPLLLSRAACWGSHALKSYPESQWKQGGEWFDTCCPDLTYCMVTTWCVLHKKPNYVLLCRHKSDCPW